MISISKTSTFDDKTPRASPTSPSAHWRHRGHPATALVQQHVGTQPEAPAAAPSPSLLPNHTVNTYIFTAENESAHKPRAVISATQGQHAALNSAFVPASLFIPGAPSAPLLQTKSSWPQTKTPSSLAQQSCALGGKVGAQLAELRMLSVITTHQVQPSMSVAQPREELW